MPDAAFYLLATETVDTKRLPSLVGGKRGEPAIYLEAVSCTPLDPVSEQTALRLRLNTPHTLRQVHMEDSVDIIKGDVLVLDGRDYPVQAVEKRKWPLDASYYLAVYVEALER